MAHTMRMLFQDVKTRRYVFWQLFKWCDYLQLFDGKIAKLALLIPLVGYLVLFNDYVSQHLSFNTLAHESSSQFGLSSSSRLKLIYLGLTSLGLGTAISALRRPAILKIGKSEFEYVERAFSHYTLADFAWIYFLMQSGPKLAYTSDWEYSEPEFKEFYDATIAKHRGRLVSDINWTHNKDRLNGPLRAMLKEHYLRSVVERRYTLLLCVTLALSGYFLLAIPSLDLFLKVVWVVAKSWL